MKQFILLLACALFIACESETKALRFNEKDQVFEISKVSELRYLKMVASSVLASDRNIQSEEGKLIPIEEARIRLVGDIEIDGKWEPIKGSPTGCMKEFDGNGHSIIFKDVEYTIDEEVLEPEYTSLDFGLFDNIWDVTVKNLTLSGDITIYDRSKSSRFALNAGSLAGSFYDGVIDNCVNKVNIKFLGENSTGCAVTLGGLTGSNSGVTLHREIVNFGCITVENCSHLITLGGVVGDIAGVIAKDARIENKGNISVSWSAGAKSSLNAIGGIAGILHSSDMVSCFHNYADIRIEPVSHNLDAHIGGVVGNLGNAVGSSEWVVVSELYNSGKIEVCGNLLSSFSYVGGIAGETERCYLHRLINDGKIVLVNGNPCEVGGIIGSNNISAGSTVYLCCKDNVADFPLVGKKDGMGMYACDESHK